MYGTSQLKAFQSLSRHPYPAPIFKLLVPVALSYTEPMTNPLRVLFLGSGDLACPALERILAVPFCRVVTVVSQPDRPKGRHRRRQACPAKALAEERGVPILTPERIGAPDVVATLAAVASDIIVVAAYGQYIPRSLLAVPPLGAINIHPSLLPKYRGASPIQWAVANGDDVTGVTILYVSETMDAGDIILQRAVPIVPADNTLTLTPYLAGLGADLLIEALDAVRRGMAPRIPQDDQQAITVHKLKKADGCIDWSWPAETIHNRIRGFLPWPGCYTSWGGGALKIWSSHLQAGSVPASVPGQVVQCSPRGPVIATGQGGICLTEVQPEGGTRMAAAAFLCGHPLKPGDVLG